MHYATAGGDAQAMSLSAESRARLEELIASFLDGALTPAEEQEFAQSLSDPYARKIYHDHASMHAMLNWEHGTTRLHAAPVLPPVRSPRRAIWRLVSLVTAAMVLVSIGSVLVYDYARPY